MKRIWVNGLLAFAVAALLIFAGGFAYTVVDEAFLTSGDSEEIRAGTMAPERQFVRMPILSERAVAEEEDSGAEDDDNVRLLALGDSLTRGMGSSDGEGYLRHVEESFPENFDKELTVENEAVDGYQTQDVLNDIGGLELNGQVRAADLIVMTIGGNDLFQGVEGFLDDFEDFTDRSQEEFLLDLEKLYEELTHTNSEAQIYHIGIYNPLREFGLSGEDEQFLREWNYATLELAADYEQVTYVPVEDMFEQNGTDYLSGDFFHLNDDGYKQVADRLMTTLRWPEEEGSS